MELSSLQILQFQEKEFLLVPGLFNRQETDSILKEMPNVIAEDCPRRILEKNGQLRSFFAPEQTSELFSMVISIDRLVLSVQRLLEGPVYAHQTKLNTKYALTGDSWEWHRDYTFWKRDDGMLQPRVLTVMIFLNDITEFNGPLLLIPASHTVDDIDDEQNIINEQEGWYSEYKQSTNYMSALTSGLKYTLKQRTIAHWAEKNGIEAAKGPAGSVLFFHGNIFHASGNNLSPWDRHTFLITYNSVENKLVDIENPRPTFIANRNFSPIKPVSCSLI